MYGLESAAAPDSGPAEERRQERFSVPRCFQPPAAGLFMHSVVNVRNAFRRQNISYNINFTFNVLSAEIVLEGSVVVFQTCTPKELLIGLLEQLEHDDPDTIAESLHLLLGPLQKGKEHFFKYVLQYICQHVISSVSPPLSTLSSC